MLVSQMFGLDKVPFVYVVAQYFTENRLCVNLKSLRDKAVYAITKICNVDLSAYFIALFTVKNSFKGHFAQFAIPVNCAIKNIVIIQCQSIIYMPI